MARCELIHGDAFEVLAAMDEASVSAIVTDPPYGLEFMGKAWDSFRASNAGIEPTEEKPLGVSARGAPVFSPNRRNQKCPKCGRWAYDHEGRRCTCNGWRQPAQLQYARAFGEWTRSWAELALRVLRPGGHLLAFGGTRTFHRLATGLEDAGFEVRDCLSWIHGQGFPKSHDVAKAIDKAAGAERTLRPNDRWSERYPNGPGGNLSGGDRAATVHQLKHRDGQLLTSDPVTDAAREWHGYGTALKPAWEPIILARKPLSGTVEANCREHGAGALNVDGCRVDADWESDPSKRGFGHGYHADAKYSERASVPIGSKASTWEPIDGRGRWPANVILDEESGHLLDEQSGERTSGELRPEHQERGGFAGTVNAYGTAKAGGSQHFEANSGGASRFFYCAKASKADRTCGGAVSNRHPTVKPLELMRWLVRLVRMPGDRNLILDPFAGSGTTLLAAAVEGVPIVGIEREAESVETARGRLEALRRDRERAGGGPALFEGTDDGRAPSWQAAD